MIPESVYGELITLALTDGAKKAIKYISEKEVVKATFRGKRDRRSSTKTILVTIGRPNFSERARIKKTKKLGQQIAGALEVKLEKKKK